MFYDIFYDIFEGKSRKIVLFCRKNFKLIKLYKCITDVPIGIGFRG
jgi:hypothetical protein